MKKTKLTRSLLAACSIVALSAVMYGCAHTDSGPSQEELDAANAATATAAAEAKANADAAAAAVQAKADADAAAAAAATAAADAAAAEAADAKAAADAAAAAAATAAADAAADAKAAADAAAAAAATAAADAAADAKAAADEAAAAAEAARQAAQDEADSLQGEVDDAAEAAHMARARMLHMGIRGGEYGSDTTVGMVQVNAREYADIIAVSAMHGAPDETTVTITYDTQMTPNIATDDVTYMPAFAVTGTADEIDDTWVGAVLTRTDIDASHKHDMTVYTDVAATVGPAFSTAFMVNASGSLNIPAMTTDNTPVANYDPNIDADPFTNSNFVAHNFNMDDGSDVDSLPNNYVSHRGTYAGAPGEYRCTTPTPRVLTDNCTSRLNSSDECSLPVPARCGPSFRTRAPRPCSRMAAICTSGGGSARI